MLYHSTQDRSICAGAAEAIARGIAPDGGLFVPESFPTLTQELLSELLGLSYRERAKRIIGMYLTDFSDREIADCVDAAYTVEKFGSEKIAPIAPLTYNGHGLHLLELWHGPTCAFKDMALQILPHFLTKSLYKVGGGRDAVILVATSGDTGKAALEGFRDVDHTQIIVFYPVDGVSPMQKHQMNTQQGDNVYVCAIRGNFDDAQTAVKRIFTDASTRAILDSHNMMFSSANSINWGRLLPQVVYYISAYCDMVNRGSVPFGEKINITVPTGNFGNILAGFYAYSMGLPVNRFICASNSNNVLTDFIRTGVYNRNRAFYTTVSPSMDILVSSNLERLLYHLSGGDDALTKGYMDALKRDGVYEVTPSIKEAIGSLFYGGFCDEAGTASTIHDLYDQQGYLCDTHTAVAVAVADRYIDQTGDDTPMLVASTASPYKFSKAVLASLSCDAVPDNEFDMVETLHALTGAEVPAPLISLRGKPVRFSDVTDRDDMQRVVLRALGIDG